MIVQRSKMVRAGVIPAAAILAALSSLPATAQVGSALSNNPLTHQGPISSGIGDIQKRAETETPFRIVKDVKKALDDADPKVRVDGLKKLRDLQSPEVNPLLLRGLVDADIRVKIKAIDILGQREASEAVPQMSQMLFLRSTEPAVKMHLVAALGRIADARGSLPVMQYLEEQGDERARGTAVFALGEIGDPRATDVLARAATEDRSEMVRRLAQEALEKIDGELPAQHASRVAGPSDKKQVPTDQRLSKLRQVDQEIQKERSGH
jgi:HEAT repeat protein